MFSFTDTKAFCTVGHPKQTGTAVAQVKKLNTTYPVSLAFAFNGALFGGWASRIPEFKQQLSLSSHSLSLALLCLAFGAIASFPIAGRLLSTLSARHLCSITMVLYAFAFIAVGISNTILTLCTLVFLFGALHGAMDVAMNTWASEWESCSRKALMPFFHAMFSLGAGLGAASGAWMASLDVTPLLHFSALALCLSPSLLLIRPHINQGHLNKHSDTPHKMLAFPSNSLLVVAIVAFSCALGEGAMADWAAVFAHEVIDSSHSEAAIAYVIFSVSMVVLRLTGGVLIDKWGVVTVVRGCAYCSMLGAIVLVTATTLTWSYMGFALLGIGYSIIMPAVFSRAAAVNPQHPGSAIAGVATFAYGGMLLGPVLIGFLAEIVSLRGAFVLFVVLSIYIVAAAPRFAP